MLSASAPEFSRNLGFISDVEQERLSNSAVSIAGAGGDGGMLAIQLARMGVGELRLADPDPFEAENLNRQACCTQETVGTNKATAVADYVHAINPGIKVVTYTEGITEGNVDKFAKGAQLVIDETEFTLPSLGVMLARAARKRDIPVLMAMNVGFGATVTSFNPKGKSFEKFLGLSERDSLEEIATKDVPLSRWVAYVPPYVDMKVFEKVAKGEKSAPSVAPGVAIAAGTAAVQAFLHLTNDLENNRPKPVYAPHVMVVDAYSGANKVVKHPVLSHYLSLVKVVARNMMGRNPSANY